MLVASSLIHRITAFRLSSVSLRRVGLDEYAGGEGESRLTVDQHAHDACGRAFIMMAIGMVSAIGKPILAGRGRAIGRLIEETPEQVRASRQMSATELSLDAPIDRSDREASTLGERFVGVEGGEIEENCDFKLMREFIDRVFRQYLTPRERKILYLYYGLDEGAEAMTLEKIGALMGVTRERIRQIRERAFEKLRGSPHGNALASFWTAA